MILGIGTDILFIPRVEKLYDKHGIEAAKKLLSEAELLEFSKAKDPARFLAKRFAAKEALGKALGIGVASPATLPNSTLCHDALGKPFFTFAPELAAYLVAKNASVQISLSDEKEYVVAFVIVESIKTDTTLA